MYDSVPDWFVLLRGSCLWLASTLRVYVSFLSRFRDHTQTHPTRKDSSGQIFDPSQGPQHKNRQQSQQTDPYAPQQYSNPQSQTACDLSALRGYKSGYFFLLLYTVTACLGLQTAIIMSNLIALYVDDLTKTS